MTAATDAPSRVADTSALRRVLDGRWARVRDELRARPELAEESVPAELDTESHRGLVAERMAGLVRAGHVHYGFPARYGGGGDIGASVTAFEMLGFHDLSLQVKAGVQWGLFGGAVQALGTRAHHDAYLPDIMSFALPGCFAMTETGHGSDVQALRTTATYEPDAGEFVVHTPHEAAHKDYIGNAARDGRMAVVFAQLHTRGEDHGVHALLVPIRSTEGFSRPGVTITDDGHKQGLNGVDNGRLAFDRVRVPRENLLDQYGAVAADGTYTSPIEGRSKRFFATLGALVRGRISVSGSAISATQLALTIAVRYGLVRRQFTGDGSGEEIVILDYLAHQRKLLPALATTYALRLAQNELVSELHDVQTAPEGQRDEHRQRALESRAAGTKALATWHASATIQAAREACGGAGYLSENQLGRLRCDTDVFTTFEGDNTVLLQLVAKGLLTDFNDEFENLDTLGTVRFVADQVLDTVTERTALRTLAERLRNAAPGRDDDSDVLDRDWQVKLLDDREQHVVESLVRRLRRATGKGVDDAEAFRIFNQAQDHLLRAARVHIDGLVLDSFAAGIERCADLQARELLERVCDLHVLSVIEADKGWFLEHGRISATRAKTVTAEVNRLCGQLRPHARTLIDAFGIPDEWIAAPIATGAEAARQAAQHAHDAAASDG